MKIPQILVALAGLCTLQSANALANASVRYLENPTRKVVSKFEPSKSDRENRQFIENCILANSAVIRVRGVISTGEVVAELVDSGSIPNPTRECFEGQSRALVLSSQQVQEMRDVTKEFLAARGEEFARAERARLRAAEIRRLLN